MPATKTTAKEQRLRKGSGASCSNCGKPVGDAPDDQTWIIWNGNKLYCPACAKKHGIDR